MRYIIYISIIIIFGLWLFNDHATWRVAEMPIPLCKYFTVRDGVCFLTLLAGFLIGWHAEQDCTNARAKLYHGALSALLVIIALVYTIFSDSFISQGSPTDPIENAYINANCAIPKSNTLFGVPKGVLYFLDVSGSMEKRQDLSIDSLYAQTIDELQNSNDSVLSDRLDSMRLHSDNVLNHAKMQLCRLLVAQQKRSYSDTQSWFAVYTFSQQVDTIYARTPFSKSTINSCIRKIILDVNFDRQLGKYTNFEPVLEQIGSISKSLRHRSRFEGHDLNAIIFSDFIHDVEDNSNRQMHLQRKSLKGLLDTLDISPIMWILYDVKGLYKSKLINVDSIIANSIDTNNWCSVTLGCENPSVSKHYDKNPIIFLYDRYLFVRPDASQYTFPAFCRGNYRVQLLNNSPNHYIDHRQEYLYKDNRTTFNLIPNREFTTIDSTDSVTLSFTGHICETIPHLELKWTDLQNGSVAYTEIIFQKALPRSIAVLLIICSSASIGIVLLILRLLCKFYWDQFLIRRHLKIKNDIFNSKK